MHYPKEKSKIYIPDNWDKGAFVAVCKEVHVVDNSWEPPPKTLLKDAGPNVGSGGSEGDYSEGVLLDIAPPV